VDSGAAGIVGCGASACKSGGGATEPGPIYYVSVTGFLHGGL